MENIIRYPTKTTPFVYTNFESGVVLVSGIAIPDNGAQFFGGITDWIATFAEKEARPLHIHFDLDYYNNSVSLSITGIIMLLNRFADCKAQIFWHFYSVDDDAREDGEDFADFCKVPFVFESEDNHQALNIRKTEVSPLIYFDMHGDFILHGNCISGKPWEFYRPVMKWLSNKRVSKTSETINFDVFLEKTDEQDIPFIHSLLAIVDILHQRGSKTSVVWKYSNPEIEQTGIEILKEFSFHYYFRAVT